MDEVRGALQEADKQLLAIRTLYEADLSFQRASPTLRGKIKAFLGNQRAALDHLAEAIVAAHAVGGGHTHYPFAAEEAVFEASLDKNMPGVREHRADVAAAIGRHQPFTAPALADLRGLLNDESQQRLVPETRDRVAVEAAPLAGDRPVEVSPTPPMPPTDAGGIVLSGGLIIDGVAHDPITLASRLEAQRLESKVDYVDWRFGLSDASALSTLESIDAAVRAALADVAATAGVAVRLD